MTPQDSPDTGIELLSVNTIRTLAMDAVQQAQSGHPGAPMGMAPVVSANWTYSLFRLP